MENNENNVQVVHNSETQKKGKKRGVPISIFIVVIIIVSLFCISIGILLGTHDELFTIIKNSEKTVTTTTVVTNVVSSEKNGKQLIIEGKDKDGKTIWSYTTPSENIPVQVTNEGIKLIETRKGKVYVCDWGKLYILDEQTGEVVAKNTETNIGAARAYTFDDDDNLYTVSYLSALNKFDSNAKLIKSTFDVWDEGFAWPKSMSINGNDLIIEFEEGTANISKDTLVITSPSKTTKVTTVDIPKANDVEKTSELKVPETSNNNTKTASGYVQEYIKVIEQVKANHQGSNLKCDLIYFNNDNTPDLVIGVEGYWVSVYMYENGTVYNPVDEWPYGAMGNTGYDYLEKKGLIFNHNSDYAGAISTDSVLILNSSKQFDTLYYRGVGADIDANDPELAGLRTEVQNDLAQTGGYYYNNTKISENEYNNKLKGLSISSVNDANWKVLCGTKTADELLKQMQ